MAGVPTNRLLIPSKGKLWKNEVRGALTVVRISFLIQKQYMFMVENWK
jgi:hypothetical protein